MIIKSIDVISAGKICGCLYAAIGLLVGAVVALVSVLGLAVAPKGGQLGGLEFMLGIGAIVAAPIAYGLLGFILGIFCAAIYNLLAATIGGLEITLERSE